MLAQLHGKNISCDHPNVLGLKREIDQVLTMEDKDGPWKFNEIFKNGPLKIRRRYLLVIGQEKPWNI